MSSETNPNHLIPAYLDKLQGRVQRLSVGVQSFDDGLLKQMDRYDKYGSGAEILERIGEASPYFTSLNVDMIFNFPAQTEDILINDIERVVESGTSQTTFYPLMASPSVARSARPHRGPRGLHPRAHVLRDHQRAAWPAAPTPCSSTAAPGRSTSAAPARPARTP